MPQNPAPVLITGASGTTGSRLARLLTESGVPIRRAGRTGGDVRFDWNDPATFAGAVRDIRSVYLIAPLGVADPAPIVTPFLAAARDAGVTRIALLGSSAIPVGTPGLGTLGPLAGEYIPEWTVLRPSWFATNFTGGHLHARTARRDGELVSATGDGRIPFIDPADIAAVAGHVLTTPETPPHDLVLTGPEALRFDDVAAALTTVTGRRVSHRRVTETELAAHLRRHGTPPEFAGLLAALDTAIAAGAENRTTTTVRDLTGTAPRPLLHVLRSEQGSLLN
ncbi:ergot alkaloid biosynthesis protein [Actinoplanes sp. G11-F43]|uniref:ergot alkaloid biosynthesis protein n=1 Tax=Actinoplanes sp. G11-F43 TaxID=3424130 RepID=UPI003D3576E4